MIKKRLALHYSIFNIQPKVIDRADVVGEAGAS
jgi:hypothetical protein